MKSYFAKTAISLCIAISATSAFAQVLPYRNPELTAEERAEDLLGRLTLDEKIAMLTNYSPAIERLGIPEYNWWNEALHGVARSGIATVFPQAIALAATFDDQAVRESFDMISDEARVKYNIGVRNNDRGQYHGLTFWTPNINIFRDPRWGRGQETYGEDPYLTGRMGLAVIKGLQGEDTGRYNKLHACAKHYAVHSGPEWSRHTYNATNLFPEELWETYLPAFKVAVVEGGVKEVMCAYNRYDDEPCCSNKKLLKQILREQWGFDGVVVSDCGAIGDFFLSHGHKTHASAPDAAADAILTGNDLECGNNAYPRVRESIEAGLMTEADLDRSVRRLLTARFSLGNLFDDELTPWWNLPDSILACSQHRSKALEMAHKSIVLLTNHNNTLPLANNSVRKIAVVGPNAADTLMMWGNYNGYPKSTVSILDGIRTKYPNAEVVYVKGCDYVSEKAMISEFDKISYKGQKGMKGTFWRNRTMDGNPMRTKQFSEPIDYTNNGETAIARDVPVIDFSARFEGTYVPDKSCKVAFCVSADDGYRLSINGEPVLDYWVDGYKNEQRYELDAIKDKKYEVVLEYYQAHGGAELKFDLGESTVVDYDGVASTVADADVIVFVGGLSPRLEGEEMSVRLPGFKGGDRTAIELPATQDKMLKALKATGRPVVFVACTGSAIAMPWAAENCDAILNVFYPGEAGGTAVADVIAGDYNPAGRLPVTYYASTADLPDFENYSMENRTYRYFKGKALFPFGHGLSYTTFEYGKPSLKQNGDKVIVSVPVTNTGELDGDEVVQLYIRIPNRHDGLLKTLKSFRRVSVKAGETINVVFELLRETFESYDTNAECMRVIPGQYEILCGGSSDDRSLKSVDYILN